MAFKHTKESVSANIAGLFGTYRQSVSRLGDQVAITEVIPFCKRNGLLYRSYFNEYVFVWPDGRTEPRYVDGVPVFDREELSEEEQDELERIWELLNIKVNGSNYGLGSYVSDYEG